MPDRSEAEQLNAIAIPPAETLARQLLFRRTCFQQTSLVQKMTFLSSINPARAVTGRRCPHSGEGGHFLTRRPGFFYENGRNSGKESRKIAPKVGSEQSLKGLQTGC